MKKGTKALVALLLGCGLVLGGCNTNKGKTEPEGGDTPGGETTQYTVAISNKTALQAEWPANGGGRKVELTVEPKANIAQLINNGTIKLQSSNTNVLTITGQMAMPVAAGNATITVSSGESSDSVAVVIDEALTIKVKYGVDHEGTEDDPLTNEEAISIAKNDLYNEDGGHEDLHVRGIIQRFYQAPGSRADGQVSFYLEPAQEGGEQFEIFKCFKKGTGEASYLTYQDVWVGADVLVHGRFTVYQETQAETESATFVRSWGEPPVDPVEIQSTFSEALTVGKALADGADSYDYYIFDAYVTKNSGTNYFLTATQGEEITDEKANTIEIYKAEAAGLADKLLKNAKITVKMVLKNYHGQVENGPALAAADVTVLEPGTPWVVPEHTVTVAQGLEVINGLNDGQITDDLYVFEEVYVKAVTGAYNPTYGNMSFTIADTADGTDTITVFRAKTDAETAANVVAGAQVTIKGNLQKFVKDEAMTPELINVNSITVKDSGGGGGGGGDVDYGTAESPITLAAAHAIASSLATNAVTPQVVYATGVITTAVDNSGSYIKSFTVKDAEDATKSLLVYSCNKNGTLGDPAQNDTITLCGYIKNYNGTLEFTTNSGTYVTFIGLTRGVSQITSVANDSTITGLISQAANNTEVQFTVAANEGFQIDSVKAYGQDLVGNDGVYQFKVMGDVNVVVSTSEAGSSKTIVNKTVEQLTADNSWTPSAGQDIGTKFTSFKLGDVTVSVTGGTGNTITVWSNGTEMRIYGGKSSTVTMTITADAGYEIDKFAVTYTTNNTNGTFDIASGVEDTVNAASKSYAFTVSSAGTSQLKPTAFSVTYHAVSA